VDWLLGESSNPSLRDFSWFRRATVSLICILAVVWSWPYASKWWLNWEWQQQLASPTGKSSEDVLPILLALNELNPDRSDEIVQQLGSADTRKRAIAFHLLEQRIQEWSGTTRPTAEELISLVDALSSDQLRLPDSIILRGKLAALLRPFIQRDVPDASKHLASIDAMVTQAEPSAPIGIALAPVGLATKSPAAATEFRISDNGPETSEPLDPPSIRQPQNSRPDAERTAIESGPVLTSMRTLIDQAETTTVSQLPNLNISIPRTISKAMVVPTPAVSSEPVAPMDPISANTTSVAQDTTVIRGFEKRPLEELLPFLASSQSRFVQQASSELLRRGMTQSQLEIAIALAQGDVEQRLKAMEAIVRDPKLNAIPWLVWMAESADRSVRRRAIVLLGSMTDPDARRKLRILQAREPDSAIADQISQVLLASGTASISVR
jgi:hypothetical protein